MGGYKPLYVRGMEKGLVQSRQEFILPDDAYPTLENAFVWRERIKRKKGYQLLGRLRRLYTDFVAAATITLTNPSPNTYDLKFALGITETDSQIENGSVVISIAAPISQVLTDSGDGNFVVTGAGPITSATIDYLTGIVTISFSAGGPFGPAVATISLGYYPGLPVMGLNTRELNNTNNEQTIAFDQVYAYKYLGGWQEFIPGTTWTGTDSDFFWSTNWWVTPPPSNKKIFWVTNFSTSDPIRYTDDSVWIDFAPTINAAGDLLLKCLAMVPFRGRLLTFNTFEGPNLGNSIQCRQRIRWSAIGNPISDVSTLFPIGTVNANAWRDDIRGQGGFLDIPTAQDIVSVGFVRDNLVIYCERSTWQLRYTGRSIAPFQIEKVNSELGAEGTFSAVQFDTSLVGIGDKGVVECDSFKSDRIDIKIPDLVFHFDNENFGPQRVHGIRDFQQRLAFWTYPYQPDLPVGSYFPNRRLVYNYENDSWAIFTDSLTTLGTYQSQTSRKWSDYKRTSIDDQSKTWAEQNYNWFDRPALFPSIIGGNQQGFVEYLDQQTTNDVSLTINGITGNDANPTRIRSVNHNLVTGNVIKITSIPVGSDFEGLNGNVYGIVRIDKDLFDIYLYNPITDKFDLPQEDSSAFVYFGGGLISVRDNFSIVSKKFNFLEDGQNIQLGYVDILLDNTSEGAITLKVYLDYNDDESINTLPDNQNIATFLPDTFFNSVIPTTSGGARSTSKNWQRVFCATRGAFITLQYTLSNAQMNGIEQESEVQIDSQILWMRPAGRQLPVGL